MGDKKTQTLLEAMQGLVIYAHCWKCTKQFRLTPFYVIRRGWQDKDSLTFRPKHAQCGTRLSFVCIPKDKAYGYGNERRPAVFAASVSQWQPKKSTDE